MAEWKHLIGTQTVIMPIRRTFWDWLRRKPQRFEPTPITVSFWVKADDDLLSGLSVEIHGAQMEMRR